MAKFLRWASVILVALNTTRLAAQEKIDTDRPDQTESASIVPKDYFQAEIGFNKENTVYKNYELIHPTALLKYGFKRFELRVETTMRSSYEHMIPDPKWTTGLDPIEVGVKVALAEEKKILPKTSVIFHLGIPAFSSKAFRPDHPAPSFRLVSQKNFSNVFGIGTNVGAAWDGYSPVPVWLYTFSPGFNLGEKWYAYVEAFGFMTKNESPRHSVDGGLAYYVSKDVKIDISSGVGISKASSKNYFALGLSFRISNRNKRENGLAQR